MRRLVWNGLGGIIAAAILTIVHVPEVLAFPYHRQVGESEIYSDMPIPAAIDMVLKTSNRLLRHSAIYDPHGYGRRLVLTDGGWRWQLLAVGMPGTLALSRAGSEAIVINRSDVSHDVVFTTATVSGGRSLAQVIAHERTHGLIRHRFGITADLRYPTWVREGYCDYVAGGSTLSDTEAATLVARHQSTPALLHHEARTRVTAALQANGGSVDALFAAAR